MKKRRGESGQGLVEYALILVLVAVVVIVALAMITGGLHKYDIQTPADICPNTTPAIVRQGAGWGKENVIYDYVNIQGDSVHILYGQDEAYAAFQMYSRDVDPGDNCKR